MERFTPTPAAVVEGATVEFSPAAAYSPARGRVSKFLILGIPSGLQEIGVTPLAFDRFAVNALRDAYVATNPRPVSEDDVRRICIDAY